MSLPTASSHLGKLTDGGLVSQRKQGRHRYYNLSGEDVAQVLEQIMGLAARAGHLRVRTGPRDPAMRYARVCYDHLAGDRAVAVFDGLREYGYIEDVGGDMQVTESGAAFLAKIGVDLSAYEKSRRPICKACLDWSERRSHMAGTLGAALLTYFTERKWIVHQAGSRTVTITRKGEAGFDTLFSSEQK